MPQLSSYHMNLGSLTCYVANFYVGYVGIHMKYKFSIRCIKLSPARLFDIIG